MKNSKAKKTRSPTETTPALMYESGIAPDMARASQTASVRRAK
jgi:hypothetical protein